MFKNIIPPNIIKVTPMLLHAEQPRTGGAGTMLCLEQLVLQTQPEGWKGGWWH